MPPPRLPLIAACLALGIAALLGAGAGYLHANGASCEAVGMLALALVCVILAAAVVPPEDER